MFLEWRGGPRCRGWAHPRFDGALFPIYQSWLAAPLSPSRGQACLLLLVVVVCGLLSRAGEGSMQV